MSAVLEDTAGALTRDLYTRYGSQLYAYCFRRLRSREEAEDAVQTTFLNAFRALQRGTSTRAEQAWLYKIATHVCEARGTATGQRRVLEVAQAFDVVQETVPAPQPEAADELFGLEVVLEAMPENQRRAILLREWRGLSYREIADELAVSQTAVEMLVFRARRALARALDETSTNECDALASVG